MTTKAEGVAQCGTYLALLSFVEREVQIVVKLRIQVIVIVIDSWWNDIVLDSKDAYHSLNSSSGTEEVSCHTLCRADVELIC